MWSFTSHTWAKEISTDSSSSMLLEHAQGSILHAQVGRCPPEGEIETQLGASSLHPSVGDWNHATIFVQIRMLITELGDKSRLTEGVKKTKKRQLHKDFRGGYARRRNQASNFQGLQSRRSKERIGPPSPTHACWDNYESQSSGNTV